MLRHVLTRLLYLGHVLAIVAFFGWASCQRSPEKPNTTVFQGNIMTIDYKIIIGKSLNPKDQKKINMIIQDTFAEINRIYNKWNPSSELSHLNRLKAYEVVSLSPQLEQLLLETDHLVRLSQGKFDPTIEPIQDLWKRGLAQGLEPAPEEIQALAPAIGWDKLHFGDGYFFKEHDLTRLDLGGIAKGYAVDLLIERLSQAGISDLYVEWGGEIKAQGQHPLNRPWKIFISRLGDPDPQHAIALLELNNEAIATSGDYLQNWTLMYPGTGERKTYFHVMDPSSLKPLESTPSSICSASVRAPRCTLADGLATIALLFSSIDEATAWTKKIEEQWPEIQFWLLSRDKGEQNIGI